MGKMAKLHLEWDSRVNSSDKNGPKWMTAIRTSDSFISCAAHVFYAQSTIFSAVQTVFHRQIASILEFVKQTLLMETDEFKRGPESHSFCMKIEQGIVVTPVCQKWNMKDLETIAMLREMWLKSYFQQQKWTREDSAGIFTCSAHVHYPQSRIKFGN